MEFVIADDGASILGDDVEVAAQKVIGGRVAKKKTSSKAAKTASRRITDKQKEARVTFSNSTKGTVPSQHAMVTRGVSTMAARNAVLRTTELHESILVHLPVRDLFVVERVCSHWRDLLMASPILNREKFRIVDTDQALVTLDTARKIIKKQQLTDTPGDDNAEPAQEMTLVQPAQLNTTILSPFPEAKRLCLIDRCFECETLSFTPLRRFDLANPANAMFLSNPTSTKVEIEVHYILLSAKTGKPLARYTSASGLLPRAERRNITQARGVMWGDLAVEAATALYFAQERWVRQGGDKQGRALAVDWAKCKAWIKGVVFLSEQQREWLDKGLSMGRQLIEGEDGG